MQEIVIASGNRGKINEIASLIAPLGFKLLSQNDLGVPEVEETACTFVENALIKARHAARHTGKPALADDSGLEVDALNGQPGVRSARFAGEGATDADNNRLLLERLQAVPSEKRGARFHCVLVYLRHPEDPTPLICHGVWEGRIGTTLQGQNGFGYDPLFFIPALHCTSAQLDAATKNRLSHRGQALDQWLNALSRSIGPDNMLRVSENPPSAALGAVNSQNETGALWHSTTRSSQPRLFFGQEERHPTNAATKITCGIQ